MREDRTVRYGFLNYLYNFDRDGFLHDRPSLLKADYYFWMLYAHGLDWRPLVIAKKLAEPTICQSDQKQPHNNVLSPFEKIIQSLNHRLATTSNSARLKDELDQTVLRLENSQARIKQLELETQNLEKDLSASLQATADTRFCLQDAKQKHRVQWERLLKRYNFEVERRKPARSKTEQAEAELLSRSIEYNLAVKENGEIKTQMQLIREKVASMEQGSSKKRPNEEVETTGKRSKLS